LAAFQDDGASVRYAGAHLELDDVVGGWLVLSDGGRDLHGRQPRFRLPGLGSYLQAAANAGDLRLVLLGLVTLVFIIVLMDQLVWRPILAWAAKFKIAMVSGDEPPESWVYDAVSRSWLLEQVDQRIWHPFTERVDAGLGRILSRARRRGRRRTSVGCGHPRRYRRRRRADLWRRAGRAIAFHLAGRAWARIGLGAMATLVRVTLSLAVAAAWTIPVGVLIALGPSGRPCFSPSCRSSPLSRLPRSFR